MRAVHLDFLRPRARPGKLAWILCGTGALALAIAGAACLIQLDDIDEQAQASNAQLKKAKDAIAAHKPQGHLAAGKNVPEEWNRAIKLANVLNSPWAGFFGMLEGEVERPVKLLNLDADAGRQEIAIFAEAKSFDEMLSFINFLKDRDFLTDVMLQTHQINQNDREKPVRFRVTARWVSK